MRRNPDSRLSLLFELYAASRASSELIHAAMADAPLTPEEYAVYSVIPPEGCAAILWRDAKRKIEAAAALKITAADLLALGIIDEIVREPIGGAHQDYAQATALLDEAIQRHLQEALAMAPADRLDTRYAKFRAMGRAGQSFADVGTGGGERASGS